jgi:tRNA threonylcarbamoyl adenosine modification protein YeaZ
MQLAIDTSTEICSLAIADRGEIAAEMTWRCGQNHTVELLPGLIQLLHHANIEITDFDGIIVAKGPGSFNGLRVGMSLAKGLAFSLKVPLVGISTLMVEASPFAFTNLMVCPLHNAGRGEIAAALFQSKDGMLSQLWEEHLDILDDLANEINMPTIFCGEIPPPIEVRLKELLGSRAIVPGATVRLRRSGYLAWLGWQELEKGNFADLTQLEPLYLRRPPITQPKPKKLKPQVVK